MLNVDAIVYDVDSLAMFPELDGVTFLTGVSTVLTRAERRDDLGLLVTPDSRVDTQTRCYPHFAADNGCYSASRPRDDGSVKGFDADAWRAWLTKLDTRTCLFAALPDVLHWIVDPETGKKFPVGDCEATIERGALYVDVVKRLGFPAALVAQDGLDDLDRVPYDVDALFIGGSNDYKLGSDAARVAAQAKRRGLWVHMGRVNSLKRLRYAQSIGCDSADGTFLSRCRKDQQREQHARMIHWLDTLRAERKQRSFL